MGKGAESPLHLSASDTVRRRTGYVYTPHAVPVEHMGEKMATSSALGIARSYVLGDIQDLEPRSLDRNRIMFCPPVYSGQQPCAEIYRHDRYSRSRRPRVETWSMADCCGPLRVVDGYYQSRGNLLSIPRHVIPCD